LGDYSFFIKSASFLIILNAVILSFPEGVEFVTDGKLNTSNIQGTNVSFQEPQLGVVDDREDVIDLRNPVDSNNVAITDAGNVVLQDRAQNGFVTYDISKFDKNSDGFRDVYFDANAFPDLDLSTLKLEVNISTPLGLETFNRSFDSPDLVNDITSDTATFYFGTQDAKVKSIEDSVGITHGADTGLIDQVARDVGAGGFSRSIENLVNLYTTPSSGNRVLGAIFTLYLLGFTLFLLKEVVPG
jgi:hypothetical protein